MKKRSNVRVMGIMLILCFPILLSAQPYRILSPKDFTGAPPTDRYYAAYTNCYVGYSYQPIRHNGNYDITFNVQLVINNNKSWIRFDEMKSPAMLQNVLKHEQGHYNIAWLMKNELYTIFTHHKYTANYQYEIATLFRDVDIKYHKLNDDYEAQTQHMTDVKSQQKWNEWFVKAINNSPELADNRSGASTNY